MVYLNLHSCPVGDDFPLDFAPFPVQVGQIRRSTSCLDAVHVPVPRFFRAH